MLDLANDIRSLSDFKRNTVELLDRLRKTRHPLVLTINGKAELVVQDAEAYQALLDRVDVSKNAETELEELYLWVVGRAPQQGAKWFNGLERAVLSLAEHPKRCPVAPEGIDPNQPVRVLSYGRQPHVYRIFFIVDDDAKVVRVVHVRRGARRRPIAEELKGE